MTPSELKYNVETQTDSAYFSRETMKFFGDTMKNYGVRTAIITVGYDPKTMETVEVWELYRKRPVKHGLKASSYFRKDTFKKVFKND